MSWLEKILPPKIQPSDAAERRNVPEGLWIKCSGCEAVLYKSELEHNLMVCPHCGQHHRIGSRARINAFLDEAGRYEIGRYDDSPGDGAFDADGRITKISRPVSHP